MRKAIQTARSGEMIATKLLESEVQPLSLRDAIFRFAKYCTHPGPNLRVSSMNCCCLIESSSMKDRKKSTCKGEVDRENGQNVSFVVVVGW